MMVKIRLKQFFYQKWVIKCDKHGDTETGRDGDGERWRQGEMETGRDGDRERWRQGEMETGRRGDKETGRHEDGENSSL